MQKIYFAPKKCFQYFYLEIMLARIGHGWLLWFSNWSTENSDFGVILFTIKFTISMLNALLKRFSGTVAWINTKLLKKSSCPLNL